MAKVTPGAIVSAMYERMAREQAEAMIREIEEYLEESA